MDGNRLGGSSRGFGTGDGLRCSEGTGLGHGDVMRTRGAEREQGGKGECGAANRGTREMGDTGAVEDLQTSGAEEKSGKHKTAAGLEYTKHLANQEIAIGGGARLAKNEIRDNDVELSVFEGQEKRIAAANFDTA